MSDSAVIKDTYRAQQVDAYPSLNHPAHLASRLTVSQELLDGTIKKLTRGSRMVALPEVPTTRPYSRSYRGRVMGCTSTKGTSATGQTHPQPLDHRG